jgi:hypothetical protein
MLLEGDSVATGTAILYDDLLRVCGAQIERVRDRPPRSVSRLFTWCAWLLPRSRALRRRRALALYRERAPCGICARLRVIEAHYVTTFAELAADAQLDDAYQHSTGLCVPHLVHVLEIGRDGAALGKVLDETLRKWGSLRIDLQRFVAKHDHRNTARFTAAEADSYRRALEIMAGRRGVFGIDTRRGSAHG